MEVTFFQILLVTLWAFIIGIDQFNGLFHIHRPLVTGLVLGWILGDIQTGLITGATLELVAMGMVPLAGAQPPNMVIGGLIGVSFAIISKLPPEAAVAIAIPFAIAAQGCVTLIFTAFSPLMHKADKWCMECNTKAIALLNYAGMATHGHAWRIFCPCNIFADLLWRILCSGYRRVRACMDFGRPWRSRRHDACYRLCHAAEDYAEEGIYCFPAGRLYTGDLFQYFHSGLGCSGCMHCYV